ncbi:L-asparaginase, partial [Trifolium medium]|nr:L-asparaginase [Trifolium medium]
GAGVDPNLPPRRQEEAKQLLTHCLNLGISALRSNASAVDVVELVVCLAIPSLFPTFLSSNDSQYHNVNAWPIHDAFDFYLI